MSDKTKIEWSEATWNCLYGCSRVSPGCEHCYAETHCHRFSAPGERHAGLTVLRRKGAVWTGKIDLAYHRIIEPMKWQRGRLIFVNSLSDVFHENVPDEYIMAMFGIMGACGHHTFQLLTKREDRMLDFCRRMESMNSGGRPTAMDFCTFQARTIISRLLEEKKITPGVFKKYDERLRAAEKLPWPLKNVWLGVSTENNEMLVKRVTKLLACDAAVRWISAEPLLGELDDLEMFLQPHIWSERQSTASKLDWVVVGGESGHDARVMSPRWVRHAEQLCSKHEVPFLFKQWGEYMPHSGVVDLTNDGTIVTLPAAGVGSVGLQGVTTQEKREFMADVDGGWMEKVGKKKAGRLLYGRTHDGYPAGVAA